MRETVPFAPVYVADDRVDKALDRELRTLLSTCFTKPEDYVLHERRYFCDPYPHRWVMCDKGGTLIAQLGLHERYIEADGEVIAIGGLGDVCVLPAHRRKGYVKQLVAAADEKARELNFAFCLLFGNLKIYGSSGYVPVNNVYVEEKGKRKKQPGLVKLISGRPWPMGRVHLQGRYF